MLTYLAVQINPFKLPSKHDTLKQCCLTVGPTSSTLAQHYKTTLFQCIAFAGLKSIFKVTWPQSLSQTAACRCNSIKNQHSELSIKLKTTPENWIYFGIYGYPYNVTGGKINNFLHTGLLPRILRICLADRISVQIVFGNSSVRCYAPPEAPKYFIFRFCLSV